MFFFVFKTNVFVLAFEQKWLKTNKLKINKYQTILYITNENEKYSIVNKLFKNMKFRIFVWNYSILTSKFIVYN